MSFSAPQSPLRYWAILLFVSSLAHGNTPSRSMAFEWRQSPTSIALIDGNRVVWQLNYDPKDAKPYFHPLTANDGTVLTALSPTDHPWHRGLWWSWKYINGVDYWKENKDGQSAGKTVVRSVESSPRPDYSASIRMTLDYHPAGATAVLTENRVLEVSSPGRSGDYTITWQSTFTAGAKSVLLDRTPLPGEPEGVESGGYAGLSLRLSEAAATWDFSDSERGQGEADIHGRTARYVKYGSPNGPGFTLWDDDKTNPRFPHSWYASRMQRFVSPSFLYRAPFTLAADRSISFAYRVVVTTGKLPTAAAVPTRTNDITLSSIPGEMRYDLEAFRVAPSAQVVLRFKNADDMLHNVVICKATLDFGERLGQAALALGDDALAKSYVPDLPEVLFHTGLVEPGREEVLQFTAPSEPGSYPFFCTLPGHWIRMRGVMQVDASALPGGQSIQSTAVALPPVKELFVHNQARVDRLPLPDSSPTSLAVGLTSGLSYCFDLQTMTVRYAWTGRYLDVAPYFHRRGGETVNILGTRFNVGYAGPALRVGSNPTPTLLFQGYRTAPEPTLLYTVDGVAVEQTTEPAPGGIRYSLKIGPTPAPITFKVNPAGLRLSATAGTWDQGVLSIRPNSFGPTLFSVTLLEEPSTHHAAHD